MTNPAQPRAAAGAAATRSLAAEVREKHEKYLFPAVANYYGESVVLESGSGLTVRDVDARLSAEGLSVWARSMLWRRVSVCCVCP